MELVVDRESLVAELRKYGVDWLAPSDAVGGENIEPSLLIASLAAHDDPRLRQALVALFLIQPRLAALALLIRQNLSAEAAQELTAYYTAAMYLQRTWRIRLGHYLSATAELPDHFSQELELPPPDDEHGKYGLYALAEWHASHSPFRFNYLSAYEGVADFLFQSLKLKRHRHEFTPTS